MSVTTNSYQPRISAKGSLIVHTGTSTSELQVGTNAYILSAQSTATPGVSWIVDNALTAASAVGMVLISSTTTTALIDGVTFSSIPQTYRNLIINVTGRQDGKHSPAGRLWINSDSTTSYTATYHQYGYQSGAYTSGGSGNSTSLTNKGDFSTLTTGDLNTSSHIGSTRIFIPNYTATVGYKTVHAVHSGQSISSSTVPWSFMNITWRGTSAISTVRIYAELSRKFNSGTIISLYGTI
jgi:hypothetical protein